METPQDNAPIWEVPNEQKDKQEKKTTKEWVQLFWLAMLALTIRSCAFEPYNIPSSSMVPTLLVGDYLFITKFDYGYSRHSFPFSIPLIPHGRIFNNPPQRGDVVVFKNPIDHKTDYIKRVIGMPGDTIQLKGGRLYINRTIVPREKIAEDEWHTEAGWQHYKRYEETLPNGFKHQIYELSDGEQFDNTKEWIVPEGHYFLMGDNRDNSQDSRYFGFVPEELLEGKARFIFYSNNGNGWFFQIWRWPAFIRFERLFSEIQ